MKKFKEYLNESFEDDFLELEHQDKQIDELIKTQKLSDFELSKTINDSLDVRNSEVEKISNILDTCRSIIISSNRITFNSEHVKYKGNVSFTFDGKSLPNIIGSCKLLKFLMINCPTMTYIDWNVLSENCLNLQILILNNLAISEIPDEISKFKKLTTFRISSSRLSKISKELKNTNITDLSFINIDYSVIPSEVWKMQSLTNLLFDNISNLSIPKEIINLKNLQYLAIWDCPFVTSFSEETKKSILELHNLTEISLNTKNKIPKEELQFLKDHSNYDKVSSSMNYNAMHSGFKNY